jgi:endonuclease YncB( thermonuclease family)
MKLLRAGILSFALAAAVAAAATPRPAAVQGVVTQVIDGQTLVVAPTGQPPLHVRLRDIDAPSLCQPWGDEARRALAEWALNKPARLLPAGRDAQGRTLGAVWVEEMDLGRHLVEEGHAWSQRTRGGHGPLLKQERMAHALGRGLHGAGAAVLPEEYRRQHGPCTAAGSATAAPAAPVPPVAPAVRR